MSQSNLLNLNGHMILDDISTWPTDLVTLFDSAKETLIEFHKEQQLIDRAAEDDIAKQWDPAPNIFEQARALVIHELQLMLPNISAIGFHGTRLTENEINDITSEGLQPLSQQKAQARIKQEQSNGELTLATAKKLHNDNMTGDSNRSGRVCLVSNIEWLKDERRFDRLFRNWSGEAVYGNHEDDLVVAQELRCIGEPCIIIGSITAGQLGWSVNDAAGQCEAAFLLQRYQLPMEVGRDLFIKQVVPALDVVKYSDSRFESLTKESQWAKSMHP